MLLVVCEWVAVLLLLGCFRVVRVKAVVKLVPLLRVTEHFIGLVDVCHLACDLVLVELAAVLVRVPFVRLFAIGLLDGTSIRISRDI